MKKSAIRIACFLLILILCLAYMNSVFKFKYGDGIYDVTKFYELKDNTVDVLFLGSSHAFEDINTGVLWDEYGMASYIFAGSSQPMWNTYYYFKEALKTQTPSLIVLECFCTILPSEYSDDSTIIKNNFGLHWSKDKIESIKVSAPKERWPEFFLEYTQYHTRYKEITREDFVRNQGNPFYKDWKGFGCNMDTEPLEGGDVSGVTDREPLLDKTEKYYRAIIELALEKEIPIFLLVSPYAGINEDAQRKFNTAGDIAAEYGVPYLNCNLLNDEIGIDWTLDAGDVAHLNYRGNQKFTRYIGKYLAENYDIPDRRGQQDYLSWERNAEYIRQMIYDQELADSEELEYIAGKLKNDNYSTFISVSGSCDTANEFFTDFFDSVGIPKDGTNGVWLVDKNGVLWDSTMDGGEFFYRMAHHDLHLKCAENGEGRLTNEIFFDDTDYATVRNGVNIVVYDAMTEKVVDNIGFDADEGFAIVR